MKKIFTLIAFITLIRSASFAQTANLNITLSDVLSFTVIQPAALSVNFDTEEKYSDGITATATDQISVVSSRWYIVKAVAGTISGAAALTPGSVQLSSTIGTTKFKVSYLIGADGAYSGDAKGANVIPMVYTITQQ